MTFRDFLTEGRPRLIKYRIKKNDVKWTVKNVEDGKVYYIKINQECPEKNMHSFLESISAYDEITFPRTNAIVNRKDIAREIIKNGSMVIWVPANRIHFIKNTWSY